MESQNPNQSPKTEGSPPADGGPTLLERRLTRLRNNPVIASLILLGIILIAASQLTNAIGTLRGWVYTKPVLKPPWRAIQGQWTGPDKNGIIRGTTESIDALCLYDRIVSDFWFSAGVKAMDREASLALRMTEDGYNGYLVIFVPQGSRGGNPGLYLAKRTENKHTYPVPKVRVRTPTRQWVKLSVRAQGPRISVYLGQRRVFDYVDTVPPIFTKGRFGFRIFGTSKQKATADFSVDSVDH